MQIASIAVLNNEPEAKARKATIIKTKAKIKVAIPYGMAKHTFYHFARPHPKNETTSRIIPTIPSG